jgi:hypothetical protein
MSLFDEFMTALNRRVVRSIPMQPKWQEKLQRINDLRQEIKFLKRKELVLNDELWVTIRQDTESYEDMRLSDDGKFIEVLADGD